MFILEVICHYVTMSFVIRTNQYKTILYPPHIPQKKKMLTKKFLIYEINYCLCSKNTHNSNYEKKEMYLSMENNFIVSSIGIGNYGNICCRKTNRSNRRNI